MNTEDNSLNSKNRTQMPFSLATKSSASRLDVRRVIASTPARRERKRGLSAFGEAQRKSHAQDEIFRMNRSGQMGGGWHARLFHRGAARNLGDCIIVVSRSGSLTARWKEPKHGRPRQILCPNPSSPALSERERSLPTGPQHAPRRGDQAAPADDRVADIAVPIRAAHIRVEC